MFDLDTQEHWVDQQNSRKITPMHITSEESVEDMVLLACPCLNANCCFI